jgi:hypothetical protein
MTSKPAKPEPPNKAFGLVLLSAAARSGNRGAIELAAQLSGFAPCAACGYVHQHCRCAHPPTPINKE